MFSGFKQWFFDTWTQIKIFFERLLNSFLDMLKEFFYWIFESVLDLALSISNGLGQTLSFNPADYFSAIPADVSNIIGLIGLGESIAMISVAIVIRFTLQIIPFTRLGS